MQRVTSLSAIGLLFLLAAAPFLFRNQLLKTLSPKPTEAVSTSEKSSQASKEAQFVSNELLIKVKRGVKGSIKESPHDTGIPSLNKKFKEHKVVKFEKVVKENKKSKQDASIFLWYKITFPGPQEILKEKMTEADPQSEKIQALKSLIAQYKKDPTIEAVQPNFIATVSGFIPNDPYYSSSGSWGQSYDDLWSLKPTKLNMESAWALSQGEGVVVAVIDTGVDYNHPDIVQNIWTNPNEIPNNGIDDDGNGFTDDIRGWNFVNDNNDTQDRRGHGTHVAGTIAAVGNNGTGIIGVAPKGKVMSIKGLSDGGIGTSDNLAKALIYASENGAKVVNNSWGCNYCPSNPIVEDAVGNAYSFGAVLVFAAGNNADNVLSRSPQNMTSPKPVVVAASNHLDTHTPFTSFGYLVDVAAPGGGSSNPPPDYQPIRNILSLKSSMCSPLCDAGLVVGTNYFRQAGTSMASPHTAGVAALILARRPTLINEEVRQVLRVSSDDIGSPGFDPYTGAGRLNAYKALNQDSALRVEITNPTGYYSTDPNVADQVIITGTAAGPNFQQYELFYGVGLAPTSWTLIGSQVENPVENDIVGTWTISNVPTGVYTLRLFATTLDNREFQTFVTPIFIENDALPIVTSEGPQKYPHIYGDLIVWEDYRNAIMLNNSDIFLYDLSTSTERQITTHPADQNRPRIFGNYIVWIDGRNGPGDIFLYDLSTDTEQQITNHPSFQLNPAISENRIVWQDNRNGNWDIYLYDLITNTERQITTNSRSQYFPDIFGDIIVWVDERNGNPDIFLHDLSTNTERPVTTHSANQSNPRIFGSLIVWEDQRNGNSDIYLYDLSTSTEQQITTNIANQVFPAIAENLIVWQDERNRDFDNNINNLDVYLYDLSTNTEHQLTANLANQYIPAISGNKIVWEDQRNFTGFLLDSDIYMTSYP